MGLNLQKIIHRYFLYKFSGDINTVIIFKEDL